MLALMPELGDQGASPESAGLEGTESLEWEVRLWEREPSKRYLILLIALVAAGLGFLVGGGLLLAMIGFLAILFSTMEFWLPIRYRIDGSGCRVKYGPSVTEIEWDKVKRVVRGPEGLKLSPLAKEGALSPFRGVFLRFAGNEEEVIEAVRRFGDDDVRYVDAGAE
jgi:hypothetical protein